MAITVFPSCGSALVKLADLDADRSSRLSQNVVLNALAHTMKLAINAVGQVPQGEPLGRRAINLNQGAKVTPETAEKAETPEPRELALQWAASLTAANPGNP
ncbi:MAG TPA: hypothetical protein VHU86_09135 [Solirubrobacterales bacterium]|jgi:hypothetical protein|nr:hypothetical protein [Solirubrobacterales bacterium]